MLKFEARAEPSLVFTWLSPLLAFLVTLLCCALVFAALGKNPGPALFTFFIEPLKDLRGWSEIGVKLAPLLLIAVGLTLCFRANVFNIGAEGQLTFGAICGGALALYCDSAYPNAGALLLPAVIIAGVLGGMAWAALTAWLRDAFHANEILVSLMLVYIAQLLLSYLVSGALKDPAGYNFPQSKLISDAYLLPPLLAGTRLHIGIVLALAAALLAWLFLRHSFAGFRLSVCGNAPAAAQYAGFSARRAVWSSLLISGGLAGLAGVCEVLGPIGQLTPSISPGYGFAAIIVAYTGRLHPLGAIIAGLAMALFYLGGEMAQSRLGLPSAITGVLQGILLISVLACDTLIERRPVWRRNHSSATANFQS